MVAVGEFQGRRGVGVRDAPCGQGAVHRVGGGHGGPQFHRPFFRGESHEAQVAFCPEADVAERQNEGGLPPGGGWVEAVLPGREGCDFLPGTPVPMQQVGTASVLHPHQVVRFHAGGQGDADAIAERIVGVAGAAGPGVQVDEEVTVVVPVGAGPGQGQGIGVPGGVEVLFRTQRGQGRCVIRNTAVRADEGAAGPPPWPSPLRGGGKCNQA